MKMKFTEPQINIKIFMKENILTASGVPSDGRIKGDVVSAENAGNYDVHSVKWSDLIG